LKLWMEDCRVRLRRIWTRRFRCCFQFVKYGNNRLVPSTTNYIYAQLTDDSYWTKNVAFVAFVNQIDADVAKNLYLGSVLTDESGVVSIDLTGRTELGFVALINGAVSTHKHIGGINNPDPVNLSSEVQGIISQNNLPELNAELIQTGTLDAIVYQNRPHLKVN